MNDVVHAGWNLDFGHHLGQETGGLRRLLRRLDDHGVADGKSRRDLPRHQEQRQVPGAHDSHHAHRASKRVVQRTVPVGSRRFERLGPERPHHAGEDAKVRRPARDIDLACKGDRLAGVVYLGAEELVAALHDPVRHPLEESQSVVDGHRAPGPDQRVTCRRDRLVDIGVARLVDHTDHLASRRVADLERAPVAARPGAAVDEEGNAFHAGAGRPATFLLVRTSIVAE